ncbi:MAG: hypothetical protein MJ187_03960 [Alphaproteobacteria bacterium]|nr:hypothetical protein [Alphaproteobacteria bacterium]
MATTYGTAVQSGNQIIITSQTGGVTRVFDGILISYINGVLTYMPTNSSKTETYVGI